MIAHLPPPAQAPQESPAIRPGANTLMGRNPLGMWIQGPTSGGDFSHPFTPSLVGDRIRISKGLIIGNIAVEPCIGTVPVSGDANNPQPTLKLDAGLVDDLGQSWVGILVLPNVDGKLDAKPDKPQVTIVQRKFPNAATGKGGFIAIAQLFRKNDRWQVFPIAFFNYRYTTSQPAKGARQHFFL